MDSTLITGGMKMKIIELLLLIEKSPSLYIGDGDLLSLKHFVDGFCVCAQINNIDYGETELYSFTHYVLQFYHEKRDISLFQCISDQTKTKEEAFSCFFKLLHIFRM